MRIYQNSAACDAYRELSMDAALGRSLEKPPSQFWIRRMRKLADDAAKTRLIDGSTDQSDKTEQAVDNLLALESRLRGPDLARDLMNFTRNQMRGTEAPFTVVSGSPSRSPSRDSDIR